MRTHLAVAALCLVACGRDGLTTTTTDARTPPRAGRVRLAVTSDANSGYRFEDATRVWSRLTWASNLATEEVRDDDGRARRSGPISASGAGG